MGSDRMGTHNSVKITIVCLLLLFVCAAPVGEHKFKKKVEIVHTDQQLELAYDDSNQADFTVDSSGNLEVAASGKTDLQAAGAIELKPSGDTDDYLEFTTVDGVPYIDRIGGREIHFTTDSDWVILRLYEDASNSFDMVFNKITGNTALISTGQIAFTLAGDLDDYIVFSTTDDVPQISTLGDCDLKIAAASGEIQLDDNTTVNGTFDAGAGTFTSGIFNGDVDIDGGDVEFGDDDGFYLGDDHDAHIYYFNATDTVIWSVPDGSAMSVNTYGQLCTFIGQTLFGNKVLFTQTDGNEFIDSLNDGYMDYGATTAHRFNNDIVIATGEAFKLGTTQWNSGDSIDGEQIANDTIDNDSIDWGDMADLTTDGALDADVVEEDHIADNGIDSEHYNDGSIDAVHLAADVIDETKIADNGIDSEHYNDDSIDAAHIDTINCGTNCTWDAANDEVDVDDAFVINSGSDAMTGTLTADGLTMDADEEISLGGQKIDHDGTNFVFDDSIALPSSRLGVGVIPNEAAAGAIVSIVSEGNASPLDMYRNVNTAQKGVVAEYHRSRGTYADPCAVQNADKIANMIFFGYSSVANDYRAGAKIGVIKEGALDPCDATDMGMKIIFQTADAGEVVPSLEGNTRLAIRSDGTVEVAGAQTVGGTLDVTGNTTVADLYATSVVYTDSIVARTGDTDHKIALYEAADQVAIHQGDGPADGFTIFETYSSKVHEPVVRPNADGTGWLGTVAATWQYLNAVNGTLDVLTVDTTTLVVNASGHEDEVGIGVADPHSTLEVNGAISSATVTITASADDTDVSGVNTLFINANGGAIVVGGLTGGVAGQILHIAIIDHTNNITLEHVEGIGGAVQDLYLHDDSDETLDCYGGWVLVCNGTNWYDCSHAKHV